MESPYAHYDNKLGIKIKFLTTDEAHNKSIRVITVNALGKRMRSKTCSEKRLRRSSLGIDALVLFSSLSREWKDIITTQFGKPKEEIKKSWFSQHYKASRKAFEFYAAHRYGSDKSEKLDLKLVELYTYNASVLDTVLEMKTNRTAYAKALGGVRIDIWESLSNDVNAFREVPHNLPTTKDSLRRKAAQYKKCGFESIISGKLKNSNAKKVTNKEQMALLDELLAKHTNLDNKLIASLYNVVASKFDWKPITAMTVSNRNTRSKLVTHAGRNGTKSLQNNILMQVKRKRPSAPMLYWTIDGWDAELLYQQVVVDGKGHKKTTYHNRLTMVVVLDPHNNYPMGYAIGTHETPELIKKAIQNAMQHSKELLGALYMPYQLQTDNYSLKALTPIYEAVTKMFTPAQRGNAKAKVIEPYFNTINKKYCKLLNNWSGHNVDSGSKNQPNSEYLQKIKKNFPAKQGVIKQLESIIHQERANKIDQVIENWCLVKDEHRQIMTNESYLLTFGSTTGDTNKLKGEGLVITIEGQKYYYDSFDLNFRKQSHLDWEVRFDTNNLDQVLAVSTDRSERFILEQKYIQPMALADRIEGDSDQLKKVRSFNDDAITMIVNQRSNNMEILQPLLEQPVLQDTLAKHLLTDSLGQHKDNKSAQRLQDHGTAFAKAKKVLQKQDEKQDRKREKTFADEQQEYYDQQVDLTQYL